MKMLLALALTALLAACTTTGSTQTPAQTVFAATSGYNAALAVAVTYKNLPSCELPAAPKICSDKSVVSTLQKADDAAYVALQSAQTIVRTPTSTQSALDTAALWANEAVSALTKITNQLAVK